MSLLMPTAMRFYKLCAIVGTLIIIATVAYAWLRIQQFEQNVFTVYEQLVTEKLEADSLSEELLHIDKALQLAKQQASGEIKVDEVDYSSYEIERLRNDRETMAAYLQEKNLALAQSSTVKHHVMNEVRILFGVSLAFLVVGTLLAALGYLGWYYRVEVFEERRRASR